MNRSTVGDEPTLPDFFACPQCRHPLRVGDRETVVCSSGHAFGHDAGVIDFLSPPGQHRLEAEQPEHRCSSVEHVGMQRRVVNYLLPWIEGRAGRVQGVRLLEDGCGVGTTVDELFRREVDAWGIDPSRTGRALSWGRLGARGRMHIADGTSLPFADGSFDIVTSSGVLEHVGEGSKRREREAAQRSYITEMVRVLRPGGSALVAHPNGAHPLDFWHPKRWSVRPHLPYEQWMPVAHRVRRWVRASPHPATVTFLPPQDYLAFQRIRQHWYGRLLAGPMRVVVHGFTHVPSLVTGPLNPWLIAQIVRDEDAVSGVGGAPA